MVPRNSFPEEILSICEEVCTAVKSSFGPHGHLKGMVDDLGQITFTARGAAILTRLYFSHPAATLLQNAVRSLEAMAGDGTISFILLLTATLRVIVQHAPKDDTVLRRRYFTAMAMAVAHIQRQTIPAVVAPALRHMANFVSVADEEGSSMPPWREVTMLLVHSHICTGMTRPLALVLTHLISELIGQTMASLLQCGTGECNRWCSAVRALAFTVPVVTMAGRPLEQSSVVPGVFLEAAPCSASMPQHIAGPHCIIVLTVPLLPCMLGPDGKPVGDATGTFAAAAKFDIDPQIVLASLEEYAAAIVTCLASQGVRVIVSTHRLPDCASTALVKHKCIAVHGVSSSTVQRICNTAGILALGDLPEIHDLPTWHVPETHLSALKETTVVTSGVTKWLKLDFVCPATCGHTLLLYAPAPLLCDEYRVVVQRALIHLSCASRELDCIPNSSDSSGCGIWVIGGGGAPFLRCAVALERVDAMDHPTVAHPDALAMHRIAKQCLREGMISVVHSLANASLRSTKIVQVEAMLHSHRHDPASNIGLVATVSTPALIRFAEVAAVSEKPLQMTAALQPLDAIACGVYSSLSAFHALLTGTLETLLQLLRIDMQIPAIHIKTPKGDSDDSDED